MGSYSCVSYSRSQYTLRDEPRILPPPHLNEKPLSHHQHSQSGDEHRRRAVTNYPASHFPRPQPLARIVQRYRMQAFHSPEMPERRCVRCAERDAVCVEVEEVLADSSLGDFWPRFSGRRGLLLLLKPSPLEAAT